VFVLQVANSKQWPLYGTPVELPLSGQDFDAAVHERGNPTLEFQVDAGDVLYIPRGLVHDARSDENPSLHITVGVLNYVWIDLVLELVAEASLHDVAFRRSLPPGFAREKFDRSKARTAMRGLLQRLAETSNFDAILDRFIDDFISACPPLLRASDVANRGR
jgi:ribosomal protein L16 Arg81 hydroxylase